MDEESRRAATSGEEEGSENTAFLLNIIQ